VERFSNTIIESIHESVNKELNLMHDGWQATGAKGSRALDGFWLAVMGTGGFCAWTSFSFVTTALAFDESMACFIDDVEAGSTLSETDSKRRLTPRVNIE
jgi:hypothetical protein